MITLLSPAKSLDYETKPATRKHTEPRLLAPDPPASHQRAGARTQQQQHERHLRIEEKGKFGEIDKLRKKSN